MNRAAGIKMDSISTISLMVITFQHLFARKSHDSSGGTTGWGIKISNFSMGHCACCSGGREVGVVSCGWLASTIISTQNGLDW